MNLTVEKAEAGMRLDVFLSEKSGLTRSRIKMLAGSGNITADRGEIKMGRIIKAGENYIVSVPEVKQISLEPENIPLDIIYEDEELAVINKPKGLVSHPARGNESGTLVNALLYRLKNLSGINGVMRPGIVHRLDKDTTGLLVVAKTDRAHKSLSRQIAQKTAARIYIGLCEGVIKQDSGTVNAPIGRNPKDRKKMSVVRDAEKGRTAMTGYRVIERYNNYTLAEFTLHTGRTHQIRVHAAHIGHPIVGDPLYNKKSNNFGATTQLLHAYKLEFEHPVTHCPTAFTAPVTDEINNIILLLK